MRPHPRTIAALLAGTLLLGGCSGDDAATTPGTTGPPPPGETTTTTEVPLDAGTQVSVYNPSVGDCIDRRKLVDPTTKRTTTITLLLDCNLPHSYEVFAVVTYPAPTPTTTSRPATTSRGTADPGTSSSTTPPSTLPSGGTIAPNGYPGEDAVRRYAKLECAKAFEPYVGTPYEISQLELGYLLPTENDWPGRRTIACWLRTPSSDGKLVGSKRDSRE